MSLLLEPLAFPFMQRALLATVVVGIVAAVVGTFVIHKGLAFIGDALAHASFAGVAAAFVLKGNLYLGAAVAAVLTALGIGFLTRRGRLSSDTAIGVLFAGAFSLGIAIMSQVRTYTADLFALVFGNVLGVGPDDLLLIGLVGGAVLVVVAALYKELLFATFDPVMAEASGLPVAFLQYLLLVLIGITVVVAMRAIGIVLVVAMLVTPAATASMLSRSFARIMLLAALLSLLASFAGLYLSFYASVPSGAAIVLVNTALFLLVLLAQPLLQPRPRPSLAPLDSDG